MCRVQLPQKVCTDASCCSCDEADCKKYGHFDALSITQSKLPDNWDRKDDDDCIANAVEERSYEQFFCVVAARGAGQVGICPICPDRSIKQLVQLVSNS